MDRSVAKRRRESAGHRSKSIEYGKPGVKPVWPDTLRTGNLSQKKNNGFIDIDGSVSGRPTGE